MYGRYNGPFTPLSRDRPMVAEAIRIFMAVFFAVVLFGCLSVTVAYLVGRLAPAARGGCSRWIAGWCSKRGLRNRLLVIPLSITCAIVAVFLTIGLTATYPVRSNITESTRLVVRSGGNCHRDPEWEHILFETEDPDTIRTFAAQVSLGLSMFGGRCRCCGEMTFDLYRDQELHYSFSLHHGDRIRVKGSAFGDKELSSSSRQNVTDWLDQRGITQALTESREQNEERRKAKLEDRTSLQESAQPEAPSAAR